VGATSAPHFYPRGCVFNFGSSRGGGIVNMAYTEQRHIWRWVVGLLIGTFVAGIFAFAGLVVAAVAIAKLVFYIFVVLFLLLLVFALTRSFRSPRP
jgi:uncharacterized membrane protein YtjA (UPF0391 family)